jgi:hypothetical protein
MFSLPTMMYLLYSFKKRGAIQMNCRVNDVLTAAVVVIFTDYVAINCIITSSDHLRCFVGNENFFCRLYAMALASVYVENVSVIQTPATKDQRVRIAQ